MTELLYLNDAYLKESVATIVKVVPEGPKKWQIVLDKTLFYPRGGGQSTDQGSLFNDDWSGRVSQVLMKEEIVHFVEADREPTVGMVVKMVLDWERRYLHMRLHSAGHVVDFAMYLLGYSPKPLMPLKGDHSKKAFICYQGTIETDFRQALEEKSNELVKKNLRFSCAFSNYEVLQEKAIYLQAGLPKNKPLRMLTLEAVGSVADGGTQVNHTAEIGPVAILPLETKEGMTFIHYRIK